MSLSLSTMTKYTDEHSNDLVKQAVLKGKTVDLVRVQGGIKYSATINRLSYDLTSAAAAGSCTWAATGSTVLDQRTITVNDVKINEAICLNDLEDYYTSTMMNPGSYNEDIPFEIVYAENKVDQIKSMIESQIWAGNTTSGSGYLGLVDGFVKLLDAGITASSDYYGTFSTTGFATTGIADVDNCVAAMPTNIIDANDLTLFMGYEYFRIYTKLLRNANYFHYDGNPADFEIFVPGTNVKVVAVKGLNDQDRFVLTQASNLVVGTDLLNDAEDFRIWYSQDNDEVRFLCKYKLGTQVAWLEDIAYWVGV